MIEIISTAALVTIQDQGRHGALKYGVGKSGAMDIVALATGNLLLGNADDAAGIEIPLFPFRATFTCDTDFVLTGADAAAMLDGRPVLPGFVTHACAGDSLSLRPPKEGVRTYLTVAGGIDVPAVLGSRSTQLRGAFGGFEGRYLQKGDVLPVGKVSTDQALDMSGLGVMPARLALPQAKASPAAQAGDTVVRVLPAGEYDGYTEASLIQFWTQGWKVTPQSDRYGYRLDGEALVFQEAIEKRSHGIVPGVIQVPPNGQPIIQLSDAQPSGGYPKVGTVIEADLWRLAQARIGDRIRFVRVDYQEALAALHVRDSYLSNVRRVTALYRVDPRAHR